MPEIEPAITPEAPVATETETETPVVPAEEAKPDPWAGLPEEFAWARNEVETTRREAASYRTQLREEQEKLKSAKTPEEVAAIVAEREARTAELEREVTIERLARKFSLSDDRLEFLVGKTEEDLTRQAEKLARMVAPAGNEPAPVKVTKVPLSGGVSPSDPPSQTDGRQAWRDYRKNR